MTYFRINPVLALLLLLTAIAAALPFISYAPKSDRSHVVLWAKEL
ncbi:hypothetical protein RJ918_34925 [Pseudomonas aeruginosa]